MKGLAYRVEGNLHIVSGPQGCGKSVHIGSLTRGLQVLVIDGEFRFLGNPEVRHYSTVVLKEFSLRGARTLARENPDITFYLELHT